MLMAAAGASGPSEYVEDVFNTWAYILSTSNANYTVTNNIDLSGKGGLVWFKPRMQPSSGDGHNVLFDTARGSSDTNQRRLRTNDTTAQTTGVGDSIQFNSNGFTAVVSDGATNIFRTTDNLGNPYSQTAWTFREAPKFFDIVTYTGNGANRTIAHNLGSVPGMIVIKRTNADSNWQVYHRSLANTEYLVLNTTDAKATGTTRWNSTTPTSTVFSLGTDASVNANGGTYVAYIFAHNAGGFGDSGADNIISCGSYTGTGAAGLSVSLGYEPQYLLIKRATGGSANNWLVFDTMRGLFAHSRNGVLYPNSSIPEDVLSDVSVAPTADGFIINGTLDWYNANGSDYIYMAIRRPMKRPTSGSDVYSPNTFNNTTTTFITTGFPVDLQIASLRSSSSNNAFFDRLRSVNTGGSGSSQSTRRLLSHVTNAEDTGGSSSYTNGWSNRGFFIGTTYASQSTMTWNFRRARGFFDIVCYTGTITTRTVAHNLGVAPELMIVKNRTDGTMAWAVYAGTNTSALTLNATDAANTSSVFWNNTSPTSSVFTVGTSSRVNDSGVTFVAYLFASLAGISKVGSYTGNGSNQTINCGFSAGARFVLIKRTDSTGDWYVWDTARGIVSANDPYLRLNTSASEVTTNDSVDPDNSGFIVNQNATTNINVNAATYIYLAIA